jgi:hypothetical protein
MMVAVGRAIDKVLSQPPPTSSRATPHWQPPPLCHDSDTNDAKTIYYIHVAPDSLKCNLRRGALPLWVWRARCGLAPPSPLCTTIKNPVASPSSSAHRPAHSHAFCHAGLNRRPGHHPSGRASLAPRLSHPLLNTDLDVLPHCPPVSDSSDTSMRSSRPS